MVGYYIMIPNNIISQLYMSLEACHNNLQGTPYLPSATGSNGLLESSENTNSKVNYKISWQKN